MSEISARTPTVVWLNLYELDVIAQALTPPPRKRPNRQMRRLINKIQRARAKKRKRAMRSGFL